MRAYFDAIDEQAIFHLMGANGAEIEKQRGQHLVEAGVQRRDDLPSLRIVQFYPEVLLYKYETLPTMYEQDANLIK